MLRSRAASVVSNLSIINEDKLVTSAATVAIDKVNKIFDNMDDAKSIADTRAVLNAIISQCNEIYERSTYNDDPRFKNLDDAVKLLVQASTKLKSV